MLRFFIKRLLHAVPVIFGVATIVFILIHLIPGDPVDLMMGEGTASIDRDRVRALLGLDAPLHIQYIHFWRNIFNGTWGESFVHARPVLSLILEHFPTTLLLALSSLSLAMLISFPLGVLAAAKTGSWMDTGATLFALVGMSLPLFVVAPLAILYFSIHLRWLPVSGAESFRHLLLPMTCLALGLSALLTRMVRNSMLENLNEDYVRTARAKGLSRPAVLFRHTLRNALIPVVTILAGMLGSLLAGAVVTETLFDWPGLGVLFLKAFQSRDFPLVQGITLWVSVFYVLVSVVLDVVYSALDPRIRFDSRESRAR